MKRSPRLVGKHVPALAQAAGTVGPAAAAAQIAAAGYSKPAHRPHRCVWSVSRCACGCRGLMPRRGGGRNALPGR